MRRTYLISGVWLASLLGGCDSLGDCTDPAQGRIPVLVGSQVMYAGQAIIVKSCASGSCHTELSSREGRYGAPAGLDFDIPPVEATPNEEGGVADVSAEDLSRLRKHQRKVFDERQSIWEQVERGLMPPDGVGKAWREATAGSLIDVDELSTGSCPVTGDLGPITDKNTQGLLKSWLACGAPIVEANVAGLTKPIGGTVGDQFPACGGGADPTFDNLYDIVISKNCVSGCHEPGDHAGAEDFDLSTISIAYASMMGDDGQGMVPSDCNTNQDFMITPNQPTESYFYAKVGGEGGSICKQVMPFGSENGLLPTDLDLVRRWIEAGAPAPGESAGDGGVQESDNGMDAGT